MENVRELYVKGFISKDVYQKETRSLFEIRQVSKILGAKDSTFLWLSGVGDLMLRDIMWSEPRRWMPQHSTA